MDRVYPSAPAVPAKNVRPKIARATAGRGVVRGLEETAGPVACSLVPKSRDNIDSDGPRSGDRRGCQGGAKKYRHPCCPSKPASGSTRYNNWPATKASGRCPAMKQRRGSASSRWCNGCATPCSQVPAPCCGHCCGRWIVFMICSFCLSFDFDHWQYFSPAAPPCMLKVGQVCPFYHTVVDPIVRPTSNNKQSMKLLVRITRAGRYSQLWYTTQRLHTGIDSNNVAQPFQPPTGCSQEHLHPFARSVRSPGVAP